MGLSSNQFCIFTSLALALLTGPATVAATNGGLSDGGGDAIVCASGEVTRVFFADTFDLIRKGAITPDPGIREEIYTEALLRTIQEQDPSLGKSVRETLKKLRFETSFEAEGLLPAWIPSIFGGWIGEVENDHLALNEKTCTKRQLARQKISKGIVEQEASLLFALSPLERGVFKVHEALINLRNATVDTTPVRNEIKATVALSTFAEHVRQVRVEAVEYTAEEKARFLANKLLGTDAGIVYATNHNEERFIGAYTKILLLYGIFVSADDVATALVRAEAQPGRSSISKEQAKVAAAFLSEVTSFPPRPLSAQ